MAATARIGEGERLAGEYNVSLEGIQVWRNTDGADWSLF